MVVNKIYKIRRYQKIYSQNKFLNQSPYLRPPLNQSKISGIGIKSLPCNAYKIQEYHNVCVLKSSPVIKWPIKGASRVLQEREILC